MTDLRLIDGYKLSKYSTADAKDRFFVVENFSALTGKDSEVFASGNDEEALKAEFMEFNDDGVEVEVTSKFGKRPKYEVILAFCLLMGEDENDAD